jgi:hypothetical protein
MVSPTRPKLIQPWPVAMTDMNQESASLLDPGSGVTGINLTKAFDRAPSRSATTAAPAGCSGWRTGGASLPGGDRLLPMPTRARG